VGGWGKRTNIILAVPRDSAKILRVLMPKKHIGIEIKTESLISNHFTLLAVQKYEEKSNFRGTPIFIFINLLQHRI
jgi:hypothetical protein